MPSQSKRFKINAKNIFLTYPKCSLTKEDALAQILQIQTPSNKNYIKIARELHEDGEPHLHVLLQFEGKIQIINRRLFVLTSPSRSAHFHPNIQGVKSCSGIKSYLEKESDTIEHGVFQKQTTNHAYAKALNAASKDDALQVLKELAPKYYVLHLHNIEKKLERIFNPPTAREPWAPRFPLSPFINVPDEMQEWADEYFGRDAAARPLRYKSIIIEGASRTGKTMWARALGSHNYLSGYLDFNSSVYSNDVEYNVIDNVSPSYLKLKHWKELIGAQKDWQSKIKYGQRVQIKGGIPSIVLCNPGEGFSYKGFLEKEENKALKQWTIHKAKFIFVQEPLYRQANSPENPSRERQEESTEIQN